jgi:sulfopyruvate decarboxylase subunit alpha
MPVSQSASTLIYQSLKDSGVRIVSALPETWLVHLIRMAEDDDAMQLVRLAKEEEGVGVSMGAHLAGVRSAMLMQNHGFLAAINGIVSAAQLYRIPLLTRCGFHVTCSTGRKMSIARSARPRRSPTLPAVRWRCCSGAT